MLAPLTFDIAVIGGGPAGSAAALTLRRYTDLHVVLIERSCYDRVRIGETVSPAIQPLLDYLGVWGSFLREGHAIAHGTAAAWGSGVLQWHSFLLSGQGTGWHLDRNRFDAMLARVVAELGTTVLTGSTVLRSERDPTHASWRIVTRQADGAEQEIWARFLIDATGSRAAAAKQFGARLRCSDRLVAAVAFADLPQGALRPSYTIIESVPDGWWYAAPLPSHGVVATFLTDVATARGRRVHEVASWRAELSGTSHIQGYVRGARIRLPLRLRAVHSCFLEPVFGPGWLAVGDAAASFDPLSSLGVGHAVYTGIQGARAANACLAGKEALLSEYATGVAETFSNYLGIRQRCYLAERRWPCHRFWSGRQHATGGGSFSREAEPSSSR